MPGSLDGLNLAKAVWEKWPPIQIIIASEPTGRYFVGSATSLTFMAVSTSITLSNPGDIRPENDLYKLSRRSLVFFENRLVP